MSFRNPQYFSELKQINEQFLDIIKRGNERSPYYDFSPCCNDYIALIRDLENQYPDTDAVSSSTPVNIGLHTSGFVFSNDIGDNQFNDRNDEEDNGEEVPPEPKIDKYEEPDVVHSVRCKLYIKTEIDSRVRLLGIGNFYVKDLGSDKQQVVMRQEPDLRKVLLNEFINENIPIKKRPKAVQLVFLQNVNGIKSSSVYVVKLKEDKDADALYDVLNGSKK